MSEQKRGGKRKNKMQFPSYEFTNRFKKFILLSNCSGLNLMMSSTKKRMDRRGQLIYFSNNIYNADIIIMYVYIDHFKGLM